MVKDPRIKNVVLIYGQAHYDNLSRFDVDGTNFFESHMAFNKAVDRARQGKGPSLVVSDVEINVEKI